MEKKDVVLRNIYYQLDKFVTRRGKEYNKDY